MSGGGNALANDAIAGLLALARAFPQRLIAQREHRWLQLRREKAPADLEGQTVLIVGAGAAGSAVAGFAQALGMRVIDAPPGEKSAPAQLETLLPRVQWLVLVGAHTDDRHHLLDARRLALLPRGAGIVNVAPEHLIDAAALFDALKSGRVTSAYLAGTAVDSPLRALSNVMFATDFP